jgi:23S rRNA (cytosine1962-C5)-methyltransferase
LLVRPDPQAIWEPHLGENEWNKADAIFVAPSGSEKGNWKIMHQNFPESWDIRWNDLLFSLKLSPFKHTGIFAEQASNWEWLIQKTENYERLKILNLFGYTGASTVVLAKMGHQVTHVDASKPAITWANQNAEQNQIPKDGIRWILDDAVKFVQREIRRGEQYDGILLDPPAFGHSPGGKTFKFAQDVPGLLKDCVNLLSKDAKFLLLNAYATNSSALAIKNLLEDAIGNKKGEIEFGELCLEQKDKRFFAATIVTIKLKHEYIVACLRRRSKSFIKKISIKKPRLESRGGEARISA